MSAKLKIFAILILGIFATVTAGVIFSNRHPSTAISTNSTRQAQPVPVAISASNLEVDPERARYKTIPLENIKSALQGSDPASLAVDAFEPVSSERSKRQVEVVYPQPNQALVTITQAEQAKNFHRAIRYRVELSSFGRTLFVSEPPMWQIVWVGSQEK